MFWIDGPKEVIPEEKITMKEDENRYFVPGTIHGGDYLIQVYYCSNGSSPQGDRIGVKYLCPTDILDWEKRAKEPDGVFNKDIFEELLNEEAEEYVVENDGSGDFATLVEQWGNSHVWNYEEVIRWAKEYLLHSDAYYARQMVAETGYGLDTLINDKNETIRYIVACQKYGMDRLINDPSYIVRCGVARAGYGLDVLAKDPCSVVRRIVASQGYGLEELVNDPDRFVREIALEELKNRNPERVTTKKVRVRFVAEHTDTVTIPAGLTAEQEVEYAKRELAKIDCKKLKIEIDNLEIIEN